MKRPSSIALLALSLSCVPVAWSAGAKGLSDAQQRYKQERAHCMSGQSHQDRATCLREARSAFQEARRNRLDTGGGGFEANATARCNAQPASDRAACVQRILGAGSTQGSVEGGGLIREAVTPAK